MEWEWSLRANDILIIGFIIGCILGGFAWWFGR